MRDNAALQTFAATTEYVVLSEDLATTIATKLSSVRLDSYDIRDTQTNPYIKFVGDNTLYSYKYTELPGWGISHEGTDVSSYYKVARNETLQLVELYDNKNVDDAEIADTNGDGVATKYVNAWIIDNHLVAIELVP